MPGKIINAPSLATTFGSGRPGFSFQFMPDAGIGQTQPPLLPPGAHWTGPQGLMTRIHSYGDMLAPGHIPSPPVSSSSPAPLAPAPKGSALGARQVAPNVGS
jgi:hypothetical protein